MRELGISLVDDDHPRCDLEHSRHDLGIQRGAGGIVRRTQEHEVRLMLDDIRPSTVRLEGEVVVTVRRQPPRSRRPGDEVVHRVGRQESERGPTGATEGHEQLLQDLVAAVRGPHLLGADAVAEIRRQPGSQLGRLAVGVAIERGCRRGDCLRDVRYESRRRRIRVLVCVQLDRHVQLWSTVRRQTSQVVTDR